LLPAAAVSACCVCCCLQHWLSDAEVSRLMQRYDLDNSGDLSADEFEKLVSQTNMLRFAEHHYGWGTPRILSSVAECYVACCR
jgi:hypothetical protein